MPDSPADAATLAVIEAHARTLKLPALVRALPDVRREAETGGWSFPLFLKALLDAEVDARCQAGVRRRLAAARFPEPKTLDQLDFSALAGIPKTRVLQLAAGDYLDRREDMVIAGPVGTGKTHLAIAFGVAAAKQRRHVVFRRTADLVRELVEAKDERRLGRLQQTLLKADLLILDELGFVNFAPGEGELLFNLLADRHERRSTIVTTNLAFSEWVSVFGSEKLTVALLDRLAHRAHILTTKGDSYRARKGRPG